jgi:hypothetical protein
MQSSCNLRRVRQLRRRRAVVGCPRCKLQQVQSDCA